MRELFSKVVRRFQDGVNGFRFRVSAAVQGAVVVTGRAFTIALVALAMMLAVAPPSEAQTELAGVYGRVTDPSGAVIVDAEVEIRNTETGISTTVKTNQNGLYTIPSLHPGQYLINVRKPGFQSVTVTELTLNVQDNVVRNFNLQVGSIAETVTVRGDDLHINTTDGSVSTVIDRKLVESLPLNGRSFNSLLQLIPGVVIAPQTVGNAPGQFSVSGQRSDANNFTVDGVSANMGVSPNGPSVGVGQSGTGSAPAFSAVGGTSSLVSVDALQEFRIETSSFAPEFGRTPGGQVVLTTRSGTNQFHGAAFEYFRNTVMDANDWFANRKGAPRTPEHHNDFGAVLGGPLLKNKTFFFFSYEGARLRVPRGSSLTVPSDFARSEAQANAPALLPYLNAYPKAPSSAILSADGYTASFTSLASDKATLDAASIRIDHTFNQHYSVFGRYNRAPSSAAKPFGSELNNIEVNTQTLTGGFNMLFSRISNTVRVNYSTQDSATATQLTAFGGAVPLDPTLILSSLSPVDDFGVFRPRDATELHFGTDEENRTKQFNVVDDFNWSLGHHQLKWGGDYRAIALNVTPSSHRITYAPAGVKQFITSQQIQLTAQTRLPSRFLSQALSLYAQDTWKASQRLTLTYGVRWELNPAPSAQGSTLLASWINVNDPANIALAPAGTPIWSTTYGNFAPRLGAAYQLTSKGDFILRASGGIFYDLGVGSAAQLAAFFPNTVARIQPGVSLPVSDITAFLPNASSAPPYPIIVTGFSPDLKLPKSYQWNAALEKSFGARNVISATYVGQAGRDLLRSEALSRPNGNFVPNNDFFLTVNDAYSNYHALQLQYRGKPTSRLETLLNFTWSHSLDNASDDVTVGLSNTVISAASDYGSSSNDIRRLFSGAVVFALPPIATTGPVNAITRDWSVDSIIIARTGFPFNAMNLFASLDSLNFATLRPDVVPGKPYWVSDPTAPGGQVLNESKFAIPATNRQGTESRNDIPGFGLTEVDASLGRKISITERVALQFRADAFNLFNHPNFANPNFPAIGFGASALRAGAMLNQGLGGLIPLFQQGGPRSLQISLKLVF